MSDIDGAVRAAPPVRIAFVGKGGAGKSTVAGMFARLLGRRGRSVVALDSDPMPGLSHALGLAVDDVSIPDDVVVAGPSGGPKWVLAPGWPPEAVIERFAPMAGDGVRYFQYGNARGPWGSLERSQHAWSQVVAALPATSWNLVGDLPGGLRQPMNGWGKYADIVLIVTEPGAKGALTGRQLTKLHQAAWGPRAVYLVLNQVRPSDDVAAWKHRIGAPVLGAIPWSPSLASIERTAVSPLDAHPDHDLLASVDALVTAVIELYDPPTGDLS